MVIIGKSVAIVTVSQAESGLKLLQFLERRIKRQGQGPVPRAAIQRWIRTGQVRVNKGRAKPFDRLEAGQQVRIPPYRAADPDTDLPLAPATGRAANLTTTSGPRLDVVFENEELLVLAKPAGLPAHGGTGHTDSLAARLAAAYADAPFTPALVHRLDKATSGLLLAAKTYAALRRLNDLVAHRKLDKAYLAWVHGAWPDTQPTLLEDLLEKQDHGGMEKVTAGSGKAARCRVLPLGVSSGHTLLGIRLLTGRTHQIRVQLASRGHAIVGDVKYGSPPSPGTGMLLHACRLDLEGRTFTLPPPWPSPFDARTLSERFLQSTST